MTSIISTTINIENLRCMLEAASNLQACGEDEKAKDILKSMAKDVLKELK